mmetsp:Transcript_26387/g.48225  ORF Transcript_26387/g.48225 Transcript_26387/m.48225 type:complete len:241 (-) Transcript_26387:86-808(-)
MGAPVDAALTAAPREALLGHALLGSPLTLEAETYESFSRRFQVAAQDTQEEVNEELRRLDIDPEVFYRNAQRLRLQQFSPDSMDPVNLPGLSRMEDHGDDNQSLLQRWADLAGLHAVELGGDERSASDEAKAHEVEVADLHKRQAPTLHVPEHALIEEISLDELTGGETFGGRLGHETPRGMDTKLQIDCLTDDEGEDPLFRPLPDSPTGAAAPEGDSVEEFSLDPEFDYDNTHLSSRVG